LARQDHHAQGLELEFGRRSEQFPEQAVGFGQQVVKQSSMRQQRLHCDGPAGSRRLRGEFDGRAIISERIADCCRHAPAERTAS
jgi:hypothetical protein